MVMDPVLDTITQFPQQLKDSWESVSSELTDIDFSSILNIVVCGMGGSALGGRIVHSLYADKLTIPIEVVNGYHVPFYVGEKTLVIISSYSGTTEETISSLHEAREKKAQIFVITTGGTLGGLAEDLHLPRYIYEPKFNPSKQPRLALGYAVGSLLALFNKAGYVHISDDEFSAAVKKSEVYASEFSPQMDLENNEAQKKTEELAGRIPIIIASEHLVGSAHAFKNQINETAKTFSALFDIPEMNHHLLEGLTFPQGEKKHLVFLFIESDLYSDRVKKRYAITKQVLTKHKISFCSYKARSMDKLSQVFEVLTFGSFVQYYMALKDHAQMMEIPWVDYFKEEMARA